MTVKAQQSISIEMDKAFFHAFPFYCKGCGLCIEKCPTHVLEWSDQLGVYGTPTVRPKNNQDCIACLICDMICPDCAIRIEKKAKVKA